jgi:hypothetical protein
LLVFHCPKIGGFYFSTKRFSFTYNPTFVALNISHRAPDDFSGFSEPAALCHKTQNIMSRIKFPNVFTRIVKLFKDAKKKHDTMLPPKTLQPFLDEETIVLADDLVEVTAAETANTDFDKAGKEAEKLSKERDKKFGPVWVDHEGGVQALKKLYRKNPNKLGDWGVTVNAGGRISYPSDFVGRQGRVLVFIAKHNSFAPGTSPLQPYLDENEIDLAANKTDADNALLDHNNFIIQDDLREQKRMERDTTIAPIEDHLRGMGQFLVNHFEKNPKKANDWGFEIDDSPQGDVERVGVVKFSTSKTLQQLAIGKVISNNGSVAWKLFKGKTASGVPIVINPGDKFNIVRGYGTSTIQNENPSQDGSYRATFNK